MINYLINELLEYGLRNNLINDLDLIYSANLLINILKVDNFEKVNVNVVRPINEILDDISKYAYDNQLIDSLDKTVTDLFDSALINTIMPRPSEVFNNFSKLYIDSPIKATDYYYDFAIKSNYIRKDRINKNINLTDIDYHVFSEEYREHFSLRFRYS